jgi:hypothetical protein
VIAKFKQKFNEQYDRGYINIAVDISSLDLSKNVPTNFNKINNIQVPVWLVYIRALIGISWNVNFQRQLFKRKRCS